MNLIIIKNPRYDFLITGLNTCINIFRFMKIELILLNYINKIVSLYPINMYFSVEFKFIIVHSVQRNFFFSVAKNFYPMYTAITVIY